MLRLFGWGLLVASGYLLWQNQLYIGAMLLVTGGLFARILYLDISSGGLVMLLLSLVYGYHHEFTETVIAVAIAGLIVWLFGLGKNSETDFDWGFGDGGE